MHKSEFYEEFKKLMKSYRRGKFLEDTLFERVFVLFTETPVYCRECRRETGSKWQHTKRVICEECGSRKDITE